MRTLKELHRYARGNSTSVGWLRYVCRYFKAGLVGYNPNYPFPVVKERAREGLFGFLKKELRELGQAMLVLAIGAIVVFALCVFFSPKRAAPILVAITDQLMTVVKRSELSTSIELRKGLHVHFDREVKRELRQAILEHIRDDDAKVADVFRVEVTQPILIKVVPYGTPGSEEGTEELGRYHIKSHEDWGVHSIEVVVGAVLKEHVVAHELTHVYVNLLNPTLNLLLNEGLAHFVQESVSGSGGQPAELLDLCNFASDRHWSSTRPRSKSDTMASRGLGFVLVHYLHQRKGIPLKDIPLLSDADLPQVLEVNNHLRHLQLEAAKKKSLLKGDLDFDLQFFTHAYLTLKRGGVVGFDDQLKSPSDAKERFQNLMDLSVDYLRSTGLSDQEIAKMSSDKLLSHSGEAFAKIGERLDQIGLRHGSIVFWSSADGIFDAGLNRLLLNTYPNKPEGELQRAIDEGWARVFAKNKLLSANGTLPLYTPQLLVEIYDLTGPPSPARHLLTEWVRWSRADDLVNGK